jgi:uncharacterized membrane protein
VTPDPSSFAARRAALRRLTLASYLLLIALVVLWEGWLAPKAPPGFWLTLKGLPLLVPLFGLLRDRARSHLGASLLAMLYFMEGVMLLYLHRADDLTLHSVWPYALLETLLTLTFIASASLYLRQRQTGHA